MKISFYSKMGLAIIILGAILFLTAISVFTYRSDDPISPFLKKAGEFSLIAWIPITLIGIFIIAFRMINKRVNSQK